MLTLEIFAWWYGRGWALALRQSKGRLGNAAAAFSLDILVKTLFAPWKRIVTNPGAGLDAKMQALLDNLISRLVGFTVRIFVLLAAVVVLGIMLLVGVVEVLLWPFAPLLIVLLILKGIIG